MRCNQIVPAALAALLAGAGAAPAASLAVDPDGTTEPPAARTPSGPATVATDPGDAGRAPERAPTPRAETGGGGVVPNMMPFQAYLTDNSDQPIDGTLTTVGPRALRRVRRRDAPVERVAIERGRDRRSLLPADGLGELAPALDLRADAPVGSRSRSTARPRCRAPSCSPRPTRCGPRRRRGRHRDRRRRRLDGERRRRLPHGRSRRHRDEHARGAARGQRLARRYHPARELDRAAHALLHGGRSTERSSGSSATTSTSPTAARVRCAS